MAQHRDQVPGESRVGPFRAAFGVDVGGTKIAVGLVDVAGRILAKAEEPTDQSSADAPVAQAVRLMQLVAAEAGLDAAEVIGVGIGVPGMPDVGGGGVWAPNLQGWDRYPLRSALTARLYSLPHAVVADPEQVWVENDGRLATLAETWCGAGVGARTAALLVVGTGLGGGVVVDGKLLRGVHGVAGYFGWFVFPGLAGTRSDLGDFESVASGTALGEQGKRALARDPTSLMLGLSGAPDKVTGRTVLTAAAAGDGAARQAVEAWADLLAAGVANLVVAIDPEVIIIGGGLSASFPQYGRELRAALSRLVHPFARHDVRVVPARLGPRAGFIGAARFAFDSASEKETDHER